VNDLRQMQKQTTDLSKFNNNWYDPGASFFKRGLWYIINAVFFVSYFPLNGIKIFLLRLFGASVGKGVILKPSINIKYPWKLTIGNYVWIGEKVWIDNLDEVTIGSNVCISQGAMLLCGNHNYKKAPFDLMTGKIVLEDGTWIGAQSVVCPGVSCKSHSILAVGSVATGDLEAYSIYQGNPAVKVKDREITA
jgi:putative colanic acid biosynthesis acetyltransferase WcaF